jgi:hypothetical protein
MTGIIKNEKENYRMIKYNKKEQPNANTRTREDSLRRCK